MFSRKSSVYEFVELLGKLWISEKDVCRVKCLVRDVKDIDTPVFFNLTRVQKVTPQVYNNLRILEAEGFRTPFFDRFLNQIHPLLEERKQFVDGLFADLEAFSEKADTAGARFLVVKGACFRNLYPAKSFRNMGDIDLVISHETVWKGIDAFKQIRYLPKRVRLERHPYSDFKSNRDTELTFGVAQMFNLDGDPEYYSFDLHLGGFPGCGDSLLESDLWENAIPLKIGNRELLMPSLENCILIICSHTSRHGYAKLNDLNDIHACLKHAGDNLDWNYVYESVERNSLQNILLGLLSRLRKDYEVKLPCEILSRLERRFSVTLSAKLLFDSGKENYRFHGGRQLLLGRFLQMFFLYRYYRDRTDLLTAINKSLTGLYFLLRTGRPYRLWTQRKIYSYSSNWRIVIIPIEAKANGESWKIDHISLLKAQRFAERLKTSVDWIGTEIMIWNPGHRNELIFTPYDVYTQSTYDGNLVDSVLKEIQREAWEVISQLVEAKAVFAECVNSSSQYEKILP